MLELTISGKEIFNEQTQEFLTTKPCVLRLEHSLVSISKWESKWHKPFLSTTSDKKTDAELRDYIRCMTITQNVDPNVYQSLSAEEVKKINAYIGDPMTATTFSNRRQEGASTKSEVYTSELIYYWMIAYQIPFECQCWHLNRLLTLIKICSIKNNTGKEGKMSKRATLASNRAINEARRKASGSKG
jgi:hypothetical protein